MRLVATLLLAGLSIAPQAFAENKPTCFSPVEYVTQKTMFLVKDVTVVGSNCSASVVLENLDSEQAKFRITVPIKAFDSDDADRDADVQQILGADKQADILIETATWPKEQWQTLWQRKQGKIPATMTIAGTPFAIELGVTVEGQTLTDGKIIGELETTYTAFKIEPPSVAGGLVASVDDYLKLRWTAIVRDIAGMGELLNLQ